MILPVTLTIAGACALIGMWLGIRVSQLRVRHKVLIGDEGNAAVTARMRAHANFTEYVPIFLILLALVELAHGSATWLWIAGIAFVLARLAHPFGMDMPGANPVRAVSIVVTWVTLVALAVVAVLTGYSGLDRPDTLIYAEAPRAST